MESAGETSVRLRGLLKDAGVRSFGMPKGSAAKILSTVWALALCGNAEAALIIGNSVTGPYLPGTNVATKSVGFLTGATALLLENIQVALGGHDSVGGTVTFTLNANNGGVPGGVITTIGTSPNIATQAPTATYTLTPVNPLPLAANTTYWIQVVLPVNGLAWDTTNPPAAPASGLATFVGYDIGGSPSTTFNAIVVNGSSVGGSPVPEPSTLLLSMAALTLLLCARLR